MLGSRVVWNVAQLQKINMLTVFNTIKINIKIKPDYEEHSR